MCEVSSRAPTRSIEQAAPNPSVYSRPPLLCSTATGGGTNPMKSPSRAHAL
jgi:hypothetical protein